MLTASARRWGERAPQDRRAPRHGGRIVGRYGGEEYVAIGVLLSDGEYRLFWPCDLEEVRSPPPPWWRALLVGSAYRQVVGEREGLLHLAVPVLGHRTQGSGHARPRRCTTGVEKAGTYARPPACIYVFPVKCHFPRVGDAGIEPATSAV
jgi:hypothetical protein